MCSIAPSPPPTQVSDLPENSLYHSRRKSVNPKTTDEKTLAKGRITKKNTRYSNAKPLLSRQKTLRPVFRLVNKIPHSFRQGSKHLVGIKTLLFTARRLRQKYESDSGSELR